MKDQMKTVNSSNSPYEKAEDYYDDFNLIDAPLGRHYQVVTSFLSGYIQALLDYGIIKPLSDE